MQNLNLKYKKYKSKYIYLKEIIQEKIPDEKEVLKYLVCDVFTNLEETIYDINNLKKDYLEVLKEIKEERASKVDTEFKNYVDSEILLIAGLSDVSNSIIQQKCIINNEIETLIDKLNTKESLSKFNLKNEYAKYSNLNNQQINTIICDYIDEIYEVDSLIKSKKLEETSQKAGANNYRPGPQGKFIHKMMKHERKRAKKEAVKKTKELVQIATTRHVDDDIVEEAGRPMKEIISEYLIEKTFPFIFKNKELKRNTFFSLIFWKIVLPIILFNYSTIGSQKKMVMTYSYTHILNLLGQTTSVIGGDIESAFFLNMSNPRQVVETLFTPTKIGFAFADSYAYEPVDTTTLPHYVTTLTSNTSNPLTQYAVGMLPTDGQYGAVINELGYNTTLYMPYIHLMTFLLPLLYRLARRR
jgi:hypothetical protein